ncbi:hypothetical protein [Formosa sp. L2A11]|uniref:hypothetical protein n=1 Tax=Formosa sp. L2A11 TaxID=2686363 RepID=UPI00131CB151|nr:hypothetical protein [Formosa sp. L2A11]
MKRNLSEWLNKGNGGRIKIYRAKISDFNINTLELQNGTYNHVLNSKSLEFITKNK